ncbi:MAG: hypothetical protein KF901_31305 [Myxococcales bacterium]|nr:hypothetical protein [Myxococcales bacterium]
MTVLAWLCLGAKALAEDTRDEAVLILEGGVHAELSGEGGVARVRGGIVIRDGASLVIRDGATLIIGTAPPDAAPPVSSPPAPESDGDDLGDTSAAEVVAPDAVQSPPAPVILTVPDDPPPAPVNQVRVVVQHDTGLERLRLDEYVDESQGDALRIRGHFGLDVGVPFGGGRRFGFSGRLETRNLIDLDFSIASFRGEHDQMVLGRVGASVRFVEVGVFFVRAGVGARMLRDPRLEDARAGFDGSLGLGLRGRRATLHMDGTFGRAAGEQLLASFRAELGVSIRPRAQIVAGIDHFVLGALQPNATALTSPTVGFRVRMR